MARDMSHVDISKLLAARLPEKDVEIEGVGTIRVRGLTRGLAILVADTDGTAKRERLILRHGLVDPVLTDEDVKAWMESAPAGEVDKVVTEIARLSGMLPESEKEAVQRFPEDTGE